MLRCVSIDNDTTSSLCGELEKTDVPDSPASIQLIYVNMSRIYIRLSSRCYTIILIIFHNLIFLWNELAEVLQSSVPYVPTVPNASTHDTQP